MEGPRRRGGLGRRGGIVTLSALLAAAALAAPARASLSFDPPLNRPFSPAVRDYTTVCPEGRVVVRAQVPASRTASIDRSRPQSGAFERLVPLVAGQRFGIRVTSRGGRRSTYFIRCLPPDFPEFEFRATGRTPLSELYAVAPSLGPPASDSSYAIVFNRDGTPVWWYRSEPGTVNVEAVGKGVLAFSHVAAPERYELHRLDGRQVGTVRTFGTAPDFHELQVLGNGDYMLLDYRLERDVDLSSYGGPTDATIFDTEIQQVTPRGRLVWSWKASDHIALDETGRWWPYVIDHPVTLDNGETVYDPTHGNSIEPDGKRVLLSTRHDDAVYSIKRRNGRIAWKLGGTPTARSLSVRDDPQQDEMFGGQHDARVMPNGTVTVHDNATLRDYAPRAVRYRIDVRRSSATLVEQVTDPLATTSVCCGSARRYPGGGWLLNWGLNPFTTELNARGRRTFELRFGSRFSYRAVALSPSQVRTRALRKGMDAMAPRPPSG